MRKFILIALSVLLVLSFTALALAEEPEIKLGGRILVRGWWIENLSDYTVGLPGDLDHSGSAFYTTNAYLTVDAKISDNVQGYMELETSSGDNLQSGLYYWGNANTGYLGAQDAKVNANLKFRQLWIQYTGSGLLGCPSGIKVGHQLLTLGEKQFYNLERFGTDAIVVFAEPTKELFLGALTSKNMEGSLLQSGDDVDTYAVLGNYKLDKDNTLGLFYAYVTSDDIDQALGVSVGADQLSLQNLGIHGHGKILNALTYAAEVDIQFGSLDAQSWSGLADMDFGGWAIMAKAGYMIPDTPLNIRASFAYGSGDDDAYDNDNDEFQVIMPLDTESGIARFTHYTLLYERFIKTAAAMQFASGPFRNTGTANTTYYNVGLDVTPMKDLTLSLDGFYLQATETDAWEALVGSNVDDSLGWEIDFKGSYKLAKNLTYFVEAALFDPDDFYRDVFSGVGVENKSVTAVIHGLNLTF